MEALEISACLDSLSIIVDTREQPSPRAKKRYQTFGVPHIRKKLEYGDYTYNFKFPDGRDLWSGSDHITPRVAIERKMNLEELSGCLTHSRKRFGAEFERAKAAGAKVYLLVEDASWEKLLAGRYATKFHPAAFFASLTAWMARYNTQIIFCKNEVSGKIIKEILYRELKEALEAGVYG